MSAAVTTQMTQRLIEFGLTTAAREWVARLTQAVTCPVSSDQSLLENSAGSGIH